MTVDEVMLRIQEWQQAKPGDICHSWNYVRAALTALVAQARDEEAWEIQSAVHQVTTGLMTCDANGSPATEYIRREQVVADIRARIAGRQA